MKKTKPVDNYLQIISLFSAQNDEAGMGSNEILRLTGKTDKQQVYQNIKDLINANILRSKRSRHSGYKEPKFLTATGKKIKQFAEASDQYRKSCSDFRKKMMEIPLIIYEEDKTMSNEKLQALFDGKNIKKIRNDYVEIANNTPFLAYSTAMIEKILLKYSMLLSKVNEKRAREILTATVVKVITEELSEMAHDTLNNTLIKLFSSSGFKIDKDWSENRSKQLTFSFEYEAGSIYRQTSMDTWNQLSGLCLRTDILDFSYLRKEFMEMAKMTLQILCPDDENAQSRIDNLREIAKNLEREGDKRTAERCKIFASICEKAYFGAVNMFTDIN